MLTVSNVEFCIKVLVEGGGFAVAAAVPIATSCCPTCRCATSRSGSSPPGSQRSAGIQVHFAESIETVQANLREVQPTILFGVPRIWEKVLAGVRIRLDSAPRCSSACQRRFWLRVADGIADTLVRHRRPAHRRYAGCATRSAGCSTTGRCGTGSACAGSATPHRLPRPIAPEVLRFFMGIGVPMHEVYGMTENTAIATANRPGRVKLGTVGEPHAGIELRIDDATGEILTRHPGTFAGYWRNPEATAANHRRGRLAAHRRRRRVGGRHVREDHRPDEGHHHHRGRQERRAVGDRERAQGLAVHQGGHRDRRPAAVSHRADRDRAGHRGGLGADGASCPTPPTATSARRQRCARLSSPSWTT